MTVEPNVRQMPPYGEPPPLKVTYGGPDRAVILQNARMRPYNCLICKGESDGRPFIDFGLDIEFYGSVYFCGYCFIMVANKLGYYSPVQHDDISLRYKSLLQNNHRLEFDNGRLRDIVGSLLGLNHHERDDMVTHWRELQAAEKASRDADKSGEESGAANIRVDEQATLKRSDDISSTPSDAA